MRPMKIKTVDCHWASDCGCCDDWWTELFVDEERVDQTFSSRAEALDYALRGFGYEVEHDYEE